MAKRRKNRTHLKGQVQREEVASNVPKSFIIKHGQVGSSINQLVRDMRKVMEPHTASRLKVRVIFLHSEVYPTTDAGEEQKQAEGLHYDGPGPSSYALARLQANTNSAFPQDHPSF